MLSSLECLTRAKSKLTFALSLSLSLSLSLTPFLSYLINTFQSSLPFPPQVVQHADTHTHTHAPTLTRTHTFTMFHFYFPSPSSSPFSLSHSLSCLKPTLTLALFDSKFLKILLLALSISRVLTFSLFHFGEFLQCVPSICSISNILDQIHSHTHTISISLSHSGILISRLYPSITQSHTHSAILSLYSLTHTHTHTHQYTQAHTHTHTCAHGFSLFFCLLRRLLVL